MGDLLGKVVVLAVVVGDAVSPAEPGDGATDQNEDDPCDREDRVEEAIELFMGRPAGALEAAGDYPPDSVYGRVMARLEAFDAALTDMEKAISYVYSNSSLERIF